MQSKVITNSSQSAVVDPKGPEPLHVRVYVPSLGVEWTLKDHPILDLLVLCAEAEARAAVFTDSGNAPSDGSRSRSSSSVGLLSSAQADAVSVHHRCKAFLKVMRGKRDFRIQILAPHGV